VEVAVRPLILIVACVLLPILGAAPARSQTQAAQAADKCCGYFVSGYVWHDVNGNGIDESEPRLVGWTVEAYNATGSFLAATTVTDANGEFTFMTPVGCGPDGVFALVLQSGWGLTYPAPPGTHLLAGLGGCGSEIGNVNFGVTGGPCDPFTQTWTLDGEFTGASPSGVIATMDDLALAPQPTTSGYAWVANQGGTVSRIDLVTGNEVGRYFTGPPDVGGQYDYLSPSRTAVDADGNCWVLNRNFGGSASLTQILATGGIDRNGNSTIETSFDNLIVDGMISPAEMLPWGQDERVARHYLVGGAPPDHVGRALAIDKEGFIWVGLYGGMRALKVDPELSVVTYAPDPTPVAAPELASVDTSPHRPYGLALSPNGKLYVGTLSKFALEIDPGLASGGTAAGPALTQFIEHEPYPGAPMNFPTNYGIAVDEDCIVWLTGTQFTAGAGPVYGCIRWDPSVGAGVPSLGWSLSTPGASDGGRGITVDFDGNVWMTLRGGDVAKYAPTDPPTWLANYPTGLTTPVGVGVGPDGHLIITEQSSPSWIKMDRNTGAIIGLPGPQLAGPYPYTYSDFTGSLQSIVSQQQGFWTAISDAGAPGMLWTTVGWNATTPPGTSVEVSYRVASSLGALPVLAWTPLGAPGPLSAPVPGQFMEVRVRLTRAIACGEPWVTPLVHDVTVDAVCDPCVLGPATPVVAACDGPQGAVVDYAPPSLPAEDCGAANPVICTPPPGSLFPIGTTVVSCFTVDAGGDTLTASFPVTVTGVCDAITGGCCIDGECQEMTEGQCDERGGIYLGNDSDCADGCDFDCARPARSMLAWFPLDSAPGGQTANIAAPGVPGVLNGAPAPVPGERVTASYRFDGTELADQISAADHPSLDINMSDVSIDAWVRTSQADGQAPIVDKRQRQPIQGYYFFLQEGYPAFQLASGNTWVTWSLSAADGAAAFVADGQWHLVAVTVDRNHPQGLKFYVDGMQVGASLDPTSLMGNTASSADFMMGRSHAVFAAATWYHGDLDEVELFRRALTADEILAIHDAGIAGKCREACSLPDRIIACGGSTVTTSITICNYDDTPHLYSWGLAPLIAAGCTSPASSFSPGFGSVTVAGGQCVSIPVTVQIPSSLPAGSTSCFQVSVLNHDTGRMFGCSGSIVKNKWWCVKWKTLQGVELPGIVQVNPRFGADLKLAVSHPAPAEPGLVMAYELRPVMEEAAGYISQNVGLNGSPAGRTVAGSVPIPADGSEVEIPVAVSLFEHMALGFDLVQVWADDDMDGNLEPVGEIVIRSTLEAPAGVDDGRGSVPMLRVFRAVPNPFNPQTSISFELAGPNAQPVDLEIFDLRGRSVKTIYRGQVLAAGVHTVDWTGDDKYGRRLASGVYLVRIVTPGFTETVKAVLVK
jgi:sugar lactone lactonase YvrE